MPVNDIDALADQIATRLADRLRTEADRLLDRAALADRLGISERGVTGLVARSELPPGFLIGGVRRWEWRSVLAHLEASSTRWRRRGRGIYDRATREAASG